MERLQMYIINLYKVNIFEGKNKENLSILLKLVNFDSSAIWQDWNFILQNNFSFTVPIVLVVMVDDHDCQPSTEGNILKIGLYMWLMKFKLYIYRHKSDFAQSYIWLAVIAGGSSTWDTPEMVQTGGNYELHLITCDTKFTQGRQLFRMQ